MRIVPTRPKMLVRTLLVFAFATAAPVAAQVRATLGAGAWSLRGETRTGTTFSPVARFSATFAHSWPVRGPLGFRLEFGYSLRGADADTRLDGVPTIATFNLTYVDVPLLAEWTPVPDGLLAVYTGPFLSYRLDARIRFRAADGGPTFTENDPTVRRTGWGWIAGAEAALGSGDERLVLGARGVAGISNARDAFPALRHVGAVMYAGVRF